MKEWNHYGKLFHTVSSKSPCFHPCSQEPCRIRLVELGQLLWVPITNSILNLSKSPFKTRDSISNWVTKMLSRIQAARISFAHDESYSKLRLIARLKLLISNTTQMFKCQEQWRVRSSRTWSPSVSSPRCPSPELNMRQKKWALSSPWLVLAVRSFWCSWKIKWGITVA